jgi:hypothetical protein
MAWRVRSHARLLDHDAAELVPVALEDEQIVRHLVEQCLVVGEWS